MTSIISRKNASLTPKKVNDFYVMFLELPENIANILGRQIRGMDRPSITFDNAPVGSKNLYKQTVGQIRFDPIQIEFIDDINSLAMEAIYSQIFRQAGTKVNIDDKVGDDAKFRMHVDVYGADETVVEKFTLLGCLITSVTSNQGVFSGSEDNILTVSIVYDMLDFGVVEKVTM